MTHNPIRDFEELRDLPDLATQAGEAGDVRELDRLASRVLQLTHRNWGHPQLLDHFLRASGAVVVCRSAATRHARRPLLHPSTPPRPEQPQP